MTTWRDITDQLTLGQMAELADAECHGVCDEALLWCARDYASVNLRRIFELPSAKVKR